MTELITIAILLMLTVGILYDHREPSTPGGWWDFLVNA